MNVTDPRIAEFLEVWHENGRQCFNESYPSLDYDSDYYRKTAKDRRKYIALDDGTSGAFLVEKATGNVYRIKAYGVAGRMIGTLDSLIADYKAANESNRLNGARWSSAYGKA